MTKIATLDRSTTREIGLALQASVQAVAKELGVKIEYAGGSFAPFEATLKLKITVSSPEAQANKDEAERMNLQLLGLDPNALGRTFTQGGVEYRITGANLGRGRFPISAKRVRDEKGFKFPKEVTRLIDA